MRTLDFTLNSALRQMLDDSELGHAELAERIEIGTGSITNYTRGRTVPKWRVVQDWAIECGYDPDDPTLREL